MQPLFITGSTRTIAALEQRFIGQMRVIFFETLPQPFRLKQIADNRP
jgi:hypothetical protein